MDSKSIEKVRLPFLVLYPQAAIFFWFQIYVWNLVNSSPILIYRAKNEH